MNDEIKNDRGEIMLEAVFGITVTILVLFVLLSLGFYLYQRVMLTIVTNDVVEEVAQTYKYLDVKDASSLSESDLQNVQMYRYWVRAGNHRRQNSEKAFSLFLFEKDAPSFLDAKVGSKIVFEVNKGGIGRQYVTVTAEVDYPIILDELCEKIGLDLESKMTATARAECMDISYYVNAVKLTNYVVNQAEEDSSVLSMVSSAISLIKSVYSIFTPGE